MSRRRDLDQMVVSRFEDLDRMKKTRAEEVIKQRTEDAENKKKANAKSKWNSFHKGDVDDLREFTEEERQLMASVQNADELTLDDDGRVIRVADAIEKKEREMERQVLETQGEIKPLISVGEEDVSVIREGRNPGRFSDPRRLAVRGALAAAREERKDVTPTDMLDVTDQDVDPVVNNDIVQLDDNDFDF